MDPTPCTPPLSPPDPRVEPLDDVIDEITQILGEGRRIDTAVYLSRYPALAPGLKRFFDDRGLPGRRSAELGVGTVLDDYRITGILGRGGMGVVYEAEQISLKRSVALKVLPLGALATGNSLDRFKREASAVARLSHPRIVAVHGFNQFEGVAYLAMERVAGPDLREIIDRLRAARTHGRRFVTFEGTGGGGREAGGDDDGDLVIDLRNYAHVAAGMAADACDALRHAHAHGVIHRDIKPSNLLLAENGRIKVADFGLAKTAKEGSITKSGDFVGSPQYVSPEQASSKHRRVDERTDVYSLGVTLYELLTLHQPFAGKDVHDILRKIIVTDPPPPSRLNPRVPRDLEVVVQRALEKNPDLRYPTVGEFGDDLRRFLNYEPIMARPPSQPARLLRLARRHRVGVVGVVMAAMIAVLGGILLWGGGGRGDSPASFARRLLPLGEGQPTETGVLARLDGLDDDAPVSLRLAALAEATRALIDEVTRGHAEAAVSKVAQLQARGALGWWSDIDRRFLDDCLASVKVQLLRHGQWRLETETLSAGERRAELGRIEDLLNDADPRAVKGAAVILGRRGDRSSLGALLDALARRGDIEGRVAIVVALGAFAAEDVVEHLVELTRTSSPDLRYAALEALDRVDPADLGTVLGHFAREEQGWVRYRYQAILNRIEAP